MQPNECAFYGCIEHPAVWEFQQRKTFLHYRNTLESFTKKVPVIKFYLLYNQFSRVEMGIQDGLSLISDQ